MKTAIITIGDEILIGQIINTNAAWIGYAMTNAGFEIEEMISIGDDRSQIMNTIDDVFQRVDVILMTGGLGPTNDDITKKTLCDYFHTELIYDNSVLENIKQVVTNVTALNPLTFDQAYVPKDCTVIQNRVGSAPVTWFERNNKILVSMPGVPYEMKYVMEHEIIKRLSVYFNAESYVSKNIMVKGYPESQLAIMLTNFENNLPHGFKLAYLPSFGYVKLRLFIRGEKHRDTLNSLVQQLEQILGDSILVEEDLKLEEILGRRLAAANLTLGTAESCTGGNISRVITSVPGSSVYFKGGVVAYSNEIKHRILKVSQQTLKVHGAVSEQTVIEMATGIINIYDVDCAVAVSGIAGPDGGSVDKPVGTVWICTKYKGNAIARKYLFGKDREITVMRATNKAIEQLLEMI